MRPRMCVHIRSSPIRSSADLDKVEVLGSLISVSASTPSWCDPRWLQSRKSLIGAIVEVPV